MNKKSFIYKIFTPLILCTLLFASCSNIMDDLSNVTISYVTDKGGSVDSVKLGVNKQISSSNLPLLKEKGYTHKGWYLGDTKITNSYVVTKSITLKAKWEINTYSITYNLGGGTNNINNPSSFTVETPSFTLLNPTKEGFIFSGWENDKGENISKIEKGLCENLNLTAKWSVDNGVKYKVIYHLQKEDGKSYPKDSEVSSTEIKENTGSSLSIPSLEVLKGLYTVPSGFIFSYNDEILPINSDGSSVYNLYYSRNRYTITFDANEGIGKVPESIEKLHGVNKVLGVDEGELKKDGYSFDSWNTKKDGKGVSYKATDTIDVNESITLYAIWTSLDTVSSVTFEPKEGAIDKGKVTLSCETPLVTIYYRTDGQDPTGSSSDLVYNENDKINVVKATTIKAIAVKSGMNNSVVSSSKYTIKTYNISFNSSHSTHEGMSGIKGEEITLPVPSNVTGFSFAGWYLDENYTGSPLSSSFTINEDDVLYAKWDTLAPVSPVTFSVEETSIDKGTKVYLNCATPDSIIYYRTDKKNPTGEATDTLYDKDVGILIEKDTTITAIATKNGLISSGVSSKSYTIITYTITFESSKSTHSSITGAKGEIKTLPEPSKVIGYTFKGWYLNSEYTGSAVNSNYEISSSLPLYAKWDANTYTINFDANGGTNGNVTQMTVTYDSDVTLPSLADSPTPNAEGQLFLGWAKAHDATAIEVGYEAGKVITKPNFVDGSDGNNTFTLYAVYEKPAENPKFKVFINVTGFDSYGGLQSVLVGDVPLNPMKEGSKWYTGEFDKDAILDNNIFYDTRYSGLISFSIDDALYTDGRPASCNLATIGDLYKDNQTNKLFIDTSYNGHTKYVDGKDVWYFNNKEDIAKAITYDKSLLFDGVSVNNKILSTDETNAVKISADSTFTINAYDETGKDVPASFDSNYSQYVKSQGGNTYNFDFSSLTNLIDKISVTLTPSKGSTQTFDIQVLYPITFNIVNRAGESETIKFSDVDWGQSFRNTSDKNMVSLTKEYTVQQLNEGIKYTIQFKKNFLVSQRTEYFLVPDFPASTETAYTDYLTINVKDFFGDVLKNNNIYFDFSDSNLNLGKVNNYKVCCTLKHGPTTSKPTTSNLVTFMYGDKGSENYATKKSIQRIHDNETLNISEFKPQYNSHEFVGWYLDDNFQEKASNTVTITQDITYYAKWENLYTVSGMPNVQKTDPNTGNNYTYNWNDVGDKTYVFISGGTDGEHWIEANYTAGNYNQTLFHTGYDFTSFIVVRYDANSTPSQKGWEGALKKSAKIYWDSRNHNPQYSNQRSFYSEKGIEESFFISGGMTNDKDILLTDSDDFYYTFTYNKDTMVDPTSGSTFDSLTGKGTIGFKITKGEGDTDVRFASANIVAGGTDYIPSGTEGNEYAHITGLVDGTTYCLDIDFITSSDSASKFKISVKERTPLK